MTCFFVHKGGTTSSTGLHPQYYVCKINHLVVFKKKDIRRILHNDEWWFVIEDIVAALTDSVQPAGYIKDMRRRDPELAKGWVQIVHTLKDLMRTNIAPRKAATLPAKQERIWNGAQENVFQHVEIIYLGKKQRN